MSSFPLDDATLVMLAYSCSAANFEDGRSHLLDFLAMGEAEPISKTQEPSWITEEGDTPVFFVEYAEGEAPWSVHDVIQTLVAEIQRLRSLMADMKEP